MLPTKCPHLTLGLGSHTGRCISGQILGVFLSAGLESPALTDDIPSASSSAPALTVGYKPASPLDALSWQEN